VAPPFTAAFCAMQERNPNVRYNDLIFKSYRLGANTFVQKPNQYNQLADIAKVIGRYWCEMALLPLPKIVPTAKLPSLN
jgi:hypothetical protein